MRSAPQFAHEALLVAAEGKLSKRLGSYGAEHLRDEGVEPMALLSLLARIGTSQPVEPKARSTSSRRTFDFSLFGRAPAHFDPHEVELLNARLLHQLDYAAVAERLLPARPRKIGCFFAPISSGSPIFQPGLKCFTVRSTLPSLTHDERLLMRDAAAPPARSTGRRSRGGR